MEQKLTSVLCKSFTVLFLLCLTTTFSFATIKKVNVQNFSFSPSSFSMNLGDTVEWVLVFGEHTTTSTTIPAGAAVWNNPINAANQSFKYVPTVAGTYNYRCNIHPTMLASFTVVCSTPSATITAGGPTTFCKPGSVTLSETTGTFAAYQWKKGNNNLAGETLSTYAATKTGTYKVVVTNGCGLTATSNSISVTVNATPAATVTPAGPIDMCDGQTATLTANTGANLAYQWYKGANPVNNATNSTHVVSKAGKYKVVVTNTQTGCTKTSNKVQVNIVCRTAGTAQVTPVAPNPSPDYFVFPASLMDAQSEIFIYDLAGDLMERHVFAGEDIIAGVDLDPGIYIASIVSGREQKVMKLIKQ